MLLTLPGLVTFKVFWILRRHGTGIDHFHQRRSDRIWKCYEVAASKPAHYITDTYYCFEPFYLRPCITADRQLWFFFNAASHYPKFAEVRTTAGEWSTVTAIGLRRATISSRVQQICLVLFLIPLIIFPLSPLIKEKNLQKTVVQCAVRSLIFRKNKWTWWDTCHCKRAVFPNVMKSLIVFINQPSCFGIF